MFYITILFAFSNISLNLSLFKLCILHLHPISCKQDYRKNIGSISLNFNHGNSIWNGGDFLNFFWEIWDDEICEFFTSQQKYLSRDLVTVTRVTLISISYINFARVTYSYINIDFDLSYIANSLERGPPGNFWCPVWPQRPC